MFRKRCPPLWLYECKCKHFRYIYKKPPKKYRKTLIFRKIIMENYGKCKRLRFRGLGNRWEGNFLYLSPLQRPCRIRASPALPDIRCTALLWPASGCLIRAASGLHQGVSAAGLRFSSTPLRVYTGRRFAVSGYRAAGQRAEGQLYTRLRWGSGLYTDSGFRVAVSGATR